MCFFKAGCIVSTPNSDVKESNTVLALAPHARALALALALLCIIERLPRTPHAAAQALAPALALAALAMFAYIGCAEWSSARTLCDYDLKITWRYGVRSA